MSIETKFQSSTSISNVWLNTKTNTLSVAFKNSDYKYTYRIYSRYTTVVKEMLTDSSSLGKTINFIIRSGHVTLISKDLIQSMVCVY